MDKKKLKKIVGELEGASKMHASQAKRIDSMLKSRTAPLKGMLDSAMKLKSSGSVSWKYGDGTYHGTLIPSKETSTHRYARTHNDKIKSLPK